MCFCFLKSLFYELLRKLGDSVLRLWDLKRGGQPAELKGHGADVYGIRKGTHGVSTNGATANFMFFDRGTF